MATDRCGHNVPLDEHCATCAYFKHPTPPKPRVFSEEDIETGFEAGFKAALQWAKDEGFAFAPNELDRSVLAGNAWLNYWKAENG